MTPGPHSRGEATAHQCISVEPETAHSFWRSHNCHPAERSESRDPCRITAIQMHCMGPGSAPLRGLAGMTERESV